MKSTPFIASESLESRRLFAITLTDGVLTVEGTADGDVVSMIPRGSTLTVRMGSERMVFLSNEVDEVLVSTLGGNDRVTLGKLSVPAAIDGGDGDDRLAGGKADDVITGGNGNDRISGGNGDDQLFGADGTDKLFGDAGNDELDGGAGSDLLNGGAGFDTSPDGVDNATGMEDRPGNGNGNGNDDDDDRPRFGVGFRSSSAGFSPFTPADTTGFNVRPGTNVISPNLSTAPAGNATFVDPFTGVTLQAGGVFVNLPNTGAAARELGQSGGLSGMAIR